MTKVPTPKGQKKPLPLVPRISFDGAWKAIIVMFLQDFIAFFLPKLHDEIDFSYPPEYMEQELEHILEAKGYKKKVTDKLIKMRLKSGLFKWILLHIEVQSYFEKLFGRRMFIIFSWLFSKYDESLVVLAIYTSNKVPKIYDHFEEVNFGTKIRLDFNAYRVMKQEEDVLLQSKNIFALFVLANKYVNETRDKKELPNRLKLKEKIYELAMEREINEQRVLNFLTFVDRIMLLPSYDLDEFRIFFKTKLDKIMGHPKVPIRGTSNEAVLRSYYKDIKGIDIADLEQAQKTLQKELKTERLKAEKELKTLRLKAEKERLKAEKERLKAEKERLKKEEKIVLKLQLQDWSAEKIADVLEYDLAWVKEVLMRKKK